MKWLTRVYDILTRPIGLTPSKPPDMLERNRIHGPSLGSASFLQTGILFSDYPFEPSSAYPDALLETKLIREVDCESFPCEIRTKDGEVLFLPKPEMDQLRSFAEEHHLPTIKRVDIWGMILEPFCTAAFSTPPDRKGRILRESGIDTSEVSKIQDSVRETMLQYNITVPRWREFLGLFDVLMAHSIVLPGDTFREFYWSAMRVSELGRPI